MPLPPGCAGRASRGESGRGRSRGRGAVGGGEGAQVGSLSRPQRAPRVGKAPGIRDQTGPSPDGLNARGSGQNDARPYVIHFCFFRPFPSFIIFKVCAPLRAKSLQSCLTLCDPKDCSPPGSSVHGILQARILQWVAMPSSRGIFPTQASNPESPTSPALVNGFFTTSTMDFS